VAQASPARTAITSASQVIRPLTAAAPCPSMITSARIPAISTAWTTTTTAAAIPSSTEATSRVRTPDA
jgi:hypothetical protein